MSVVSETILDNHVSISDTTTNGINGNVSDEANDLDVPTTKSEVNGEQSINETDTTHQSDGLDAGDSQVDDSLDGAKKKYQYFGKNDEKIEAVKKIDVKNKHRNQKRKVITVRPFRFKGEVLADLPKQYKCTVLLEDLQCDKLTLQQLLFQNGCLITGDEERFLIFDEPVVFDVLPDYGPPTKRKYNKTKSKSSSNTPSTSTAVKGRKRT